MRRQSGFTLMELMLTVAIVLIVAVMMLPVITALTSGRRIEGTINQVQSYLSLARSEAISRNRHTAVFFFGPTEITPASRLMIFQIRNNPPKPNSLEDLTNWTIIPGAYGTRIPPGVKITNGDGDQRFAVMFTNRSGIHSDCPPDNLTVRIGPDSDESNERSVEYVVNRATGRFLKFNPATQYVD